MKAKLRGIIALLLLGCYIPATVGFAFIHRFCSGYETVKTETLLTFFPDQEQSGQSVCSAAETTFCNNSLHGDCACYLADGTIKGGTCFVDIKRLEIEGTSYTTLTSLPKPVEFDNYLALAPGLHPNSLQVVESGICLTCYYPASPLIQDNLHVLNGVFRL